MGAAAPRVEGRVCLHCCGTRHACPNVDEGRVYQCFDSVFTMLVPIRKGNFGIPANSLGAIVVFSRGTNAACSKAGSEND